MVVHVNGSPEEKSFFSFKMLSPNKEEFIFDDFKKSVEQILEVWQSMTCRNIFCDEEGLRSTFDTLDKDHDNKVSLNDYQISLMESPELIDR